MQFGSRTLKLFADPRWKPSKSYPPRHECYADELERLLDFAGATGQLDRYSSKLCSRERDSAIAELQVACDLADRGFQFIEFEPIGLNGKRGEFLVSARTPSTEVFVEVKAPDWHAEVTGFGKAANDPERLKAAKERLSEPKYQHLSGGAYLPGAGVEFAIEKAYEKLPYDRPTLVVVPSNGMFNSYEHTPQIIASRRLLNSDGPFDSNKFERLGGIGLFWYELRGAEIKYDMEVIPNPHAMTANALPDPVQNLLLQRLPKKQVMSVGEAYDRSRRL